MTKSKTAAQPTPPDKQAAAIAALQADQGPAVLTVAVNIVTGQTSITGIMRSETEMRAVLAALAQAQAHVMGRLEQAAEERGRAAVTTQDKKE